MDAFTGVTSTAGATVDAAEVGVFVTEFWAETGVLAVAVGVVAATAAAVDDVVTDVGVVVLFDLI